jgi:hypothetical protein
MVDYVHLGSRGDVATLSLLLLWLADLANLIQGHIDVLHPTQIVPQGSGEIANPFVLEDIT